MSAFTDPAALSRLRELLAAPKKILIVTHYNPDGDAIGSSLGLAGILKKKGHAVTVVTPNPMPANLRWMAGAAEIAVFSEARERALAAAAEAQALFCLDFGARRQGQDAFAVVEACAAPKILIDHHLEPEDFCDLVFSDTTAAATAQMVYDFAAAMTWTDAIDAEIAAALYCGIMTDTGGLRFKSVTARLHDIVADLMRRGAQAHEIYGRVYENMTLSALRLRGFVLSEKLQIIKDGKIARMSLSDAEQKRFGATKADIDEIINEGLKVGGVVMSAFFYESSGAVRASFRSKGDFSVRDFAAAHYNGGGHFNASGGSSGKSLPETLADFAALIEKIDI